MSFSLLRNVSKVSQSRSQHGQKQLHGSKPHSFLPPTSPGSEGGCLVDLAVYTQPAGIVAPAQVPLRPRGERQVRLGQEELPGGGQNTCWCLPNILSVSPQGVEWVCPAEGSCSGLRVPHPLEPSSRIQWSRGGPRSHEKLLQNQAENLSHQSQLLNSTASGKLKAIYLSFRRKK